MFKNKFPGWTNKTELQTRERQRKNFFDAFPDKRTLENYKKSEFKKVLHESISKFPEDVNI